MQKAEFFCTLLFFEAVSMNIGLVLSGGMAKGAYQIGALKALREYIPLHEIKYVSCASIGVLNGYAYLTENLDSAETLWKNLCNEDARVFVGKILRSTMLQQGIKDVYDPSKKLPAAFYSSLLDFSNRHLVYKDLSAVDMEQLPLYLKASVAMPVYNRPVQIGEVAYFDGAMVDNIPVYPLLKKNVDLVICVYFDDISYRFENTYFDNKIVKINFPGESILKQSVVFEKSGIEKMIADGYERTVAILQTVFAEGYENLDYVYNAIDAMNQGKKNSKMRITGDLLVTNLNKITQKLTKRKIL